MLVLLDGLNPQPVPGQHGFVARSIPGRREELEIPVTASQEKPNPGQIRRKLLCHYYATKLFSLSESRQWETFSRDACRKADHREEKAVQVEVLKHALDRVAVDPEGNTRNAQIQTAADHIFRC